MFKTLKTSGWQNLIKLQNETFAYVQKQEMGVQKQSFKICLFLPFFYTFEWLINVFSISFGKI